MAKRIESYQRPVKAGAESCARGFPKRRASQSHGARAETEPGSTYPDLLLPQPLICWCLKWAGSNQKAEAWVPE